MAPPARREKIVPHRPDWQPLRPSAGSPQPSGRTSLLTQRSQLRCEALFGYWHPGAEVLREDRHPELLEHPAEALGRGRGLVRRMRELAPGRGERCDAARQLRVAPLVARQPLEAARDRLEVTGQLCKPGLR